MFKRTGIETVSKAFKRPRKLSIVFNPGLELFITVLDSLYHVDFASRKPNWIQIKIFNKSVI